MAGGCHHAAHGVAAGLTERLTDPRLLRGVSYFHSCVYLVLLWAAFIDRHDGIVLVFGWAHGLLWIGMSLLGRGQDQPSMLG